ncbi:MAG: FtsX-like permease family protein [Desulfobacterales bacterium]|nr:FtsX-like permease family protein [Desulfobacterales bacterium]
MLTLMVLSAVSTLIFLSSLAIGINDAMIRNSVGLFSGHISGFDIPGHMTKKQLFTKGVSGVLKRVHISGFLHSGDRIEMVRLIAVAPAEEKKFTAIWKKVFKGRYLEPGKKEIFLSQPIAERLNIEPGDTIGFKSGTDSIPLKLTVAGIYKTGIDQFDRGVSFCTMSAIPVKSIPWNAAIFLDNGVDKELIVGKYRNAKLNNISFKTWSDLMPDLQQLIELNYISMSIVIVLVFIVVSSGIAGAFSIFILKNIREYGIMKAMGITPMETASLIFSEVILINLVASSIGIIVGAAAVFLFENIGINLSAYTSHNQYFIVSGMIFPRLTVFSLCLPPASALLFSIPAAVWPTALVIKRNAADILRSI